MAKIHAEPDFWCITPNPRWHAPETEQPYGPQATEALRKLILGKKIEGEAVTRDIYGRIVCRVVCDKRDMSLTMIR